MKTIQTVCRDPEGIHARPAGILNKAAKTYACTITMTKDGKTADMKRLFAMMGLGVKSGDAITITCTGDDEDAAAAALRDLLETL